MPDLSSAASPQYNSELSFLADTLDVIEEKNGHWHHLVADVDAILQKWGEEHDDGFGSLLRQKKVKRS